MEITLKSAELRCAFCHDEATGHLVRCPSCSALTHEDCLVELGRCPTLGCAQVPVSRPPVASPQPSAQTVGERLFEFLGQALDRLCACVVLGILCLVVGRVVHSVALEALSVFGAAEPAPAPVPGSETATLIREACWAFRREQGRLPQDLTELCQGRGIDASPTGFTLARDRTRQVVLWRDPYDQQQRSLDVAPLNSALSTVAPVASGD